MDASTGDAASANDAAPSDAGSAEDSGARADDAGSSADAGSSPSDAAASADAAPGPDAGSALDASPTTDATAEDASITLDAAPGPDATGLDAASSPDATTADAASSPDASTTPDAGYAPTYRNSLSVCWTDPACHRRMAIAHGGDWSALSAPYDSNAAIEAAYMNDLDGVKIDVRVTMDNVPVIAHSSPIEAFESLDCVNRRIEQMTAAEVTQCHRLPSRTQTFQRLDDVLNYLRGKMVAQLTVKESTDYARTIAELHTLGATDFAFLEINTQELQTLIPTITGGDRVWYLINVATNYAEVDTLIDTVRNPRAFMIELDPGAPVAGLIMNRIHPAGLKAFIYDNDATPTVTSLLAHYNLGFDAVSAQKGAPNVQARIQTNQAAGISPP